MVIPVRALLSTLYVLLSNGMSTCALGLPQPVTGFHPGEAVYPVKVLGPVMAPPDGLPGPNVTRLVPSATSWKASR